MSPRFGAATDTAMTVFPSLPALRVFAAAGRHLSFTRAAEELHVTPAAVSHQVRALEEQLGTPLFERSTRRLALTAAGRRLLPAAVDAFAQLEEALDDLRRGEAVLSITTTPSFGTRWLAPRLGRFIERHPRLEIVIRHTNVSLDLARESLDCALRWGAGRWPGLEARLVVGSPMSPVAAPGYAARLRLDGPGDIGRAALLHFDCREEWTEWLLRAGLDAGLARGGMVFDDENAMIQAALAGQGIALVAAAVVEGDVAAGRLAPVFGLPLPDGDGYYLVHAPGGLAVPKIAAFAAFLREEADRAAGR